MDPGPSHLSLPILSSDPAPPSHPSLPDPAPVNGDPLAASKRGPGRPKGSAKKNLEAEPSSPPKAKRPVGRPRKDGRPAGSVPKISRGPGRPRKNFPHDFSINFNTASVQGPNGEFHDGLGFSMFNNYRLSKETTVPVNPADAKPSSESSTMATNVRSTFVNNTDTLGASNNQAGTSHASSSSSSPLPASQIPQFTLSTIYSVFSRLPNNNNVLPLSKEVSMAYKSLLQNMQQMITNNSMGTRQTAPAVSAGYANNTNNRFQRAPMTLPSSFSQQNLSHSPLLNGNSTHPHTSAKPPATSTTSTPPSHPPSTPHRFFYWDPYHLSLSSSTLTCPICSHPLSHQGPIKSGPLRVFDLPSAGAPLTGGYGSAGPTPTVFYVIGMTYVCASSGEMNGVGEASGADSGGGCGASFKSWDRKILTSLPPVVADEWPVYDLHVETETTSHVNGSSNTSSTTKWSGDAITRPLFQFTRTLFNMGIGEIAVRDVLGRVLSGNDEADREEDEEDPDVEEAEEMDTTEVGSVVPGSGADFGKTEGQKVPEVQDLFPSSYEKFVVSSTTPVSAPVSTQPQPQPPVHPHSQPQIHTVTTQTQPQQPHSRSVTHDRPGVEPENLRPTKRLRTSTDATYPPAHNGMMRPPNTNSTSASPINAILSTPIPPPAPPPSSSYVSPNPNPPPFFPRTFSDPRPCSDPRPFSGSFGSLMLAPTGPGSGSTATATSVPESSQQRPQPPPPQPRQQHRPSTNGLTGPQTHMSSPPPLLQRPTPVQPQPSRHMQAQPASTYSTHLQTQQQQPQPQSQPQPQPQHPQHSRSYSHSHSHSQPIRLPGPTGPTQSGPPPSSSSLHAPPSGPPPNAPTLPSPRNTIHNPHNTIPPLPLTQTTHGPGILHSPSPLYAPQPLPTSNTNSPRSQLGHGAGGLKRILEPHGSGAGNGVGPTTTNGRAHHAQSHSQASPSQPHFTTPSGAPSSLVNSSYPEHLRSLQIPPLLTTVPGHHPPQQPSSIHHMSSYSSRTMGGPRDNAPSSLGGFPPRYTAQPGGMPPPPSAGATSLLGPPVHQAAPPPPPPPQTSGQPAVPRRVRHCVKCGAHECKGKGGSQFCKNLCKDCGRMDCKGRNSKRPNATCREGWAGTSVA